MVSNIVEVEGREFGIVFKSKSLLSFLITFDPGACHDHLTETRAT